MTEPTQLIISALETGVDLARGNAEAVHANYKGYYPERHAAADRDVSDMEAALTAARTHLEQPTEPAPHTRREGMNHITQEQAAILARDIWGETAILPMVDLHKFAQAVIDSIDTSQERVEKGEESVQMVHYKRGYGVALSEAQSKLVERLRSLEQDHEPHGWPAIQMRDISALLDMVQSPALPDNA